MTHRPYTPPAWQSKPLSDGRVTLLVVPLKVQPDERRISEACEIESGAWAWRNGHDGSLEGRVNLPYAPGDLIWCRETYIGPYAYEVNEYKPKDWGNKPIWFPADGPIPERFVGQFWHKARSPVTMPKWAARTWLCCTGVEVRRVQTITAYEAERVGGVLSPQAEWGGLTHRFTFEVKWNRQHGPKPAVDLSFDANPWAAFVAVEKISKEDV